MTSCQLSESARCTYTDCVVPGAEVVAAPTPIVLFTGGDVVAVPTPMLGAGATLGPGARMPCPGDVGGGGVDKGPALLTGVDCIQDGDPYTRRPSSSQSSSQATRPNHPLTNHRTRYSSCSLAIAFFANSSCV